MLELLSFKPNLIFTQLFTENFIGLSILKSTGRLLLILWHDELVELRGPVAHIGQLTVLGRLARFKPRRLIATIRIDVVCCFLLRQHDTTNLVIHLEPR